MQQLRLTLTALTLISHLASACEPGGCPDPIWCSLTDDCFEMVNRLEYSVEVQISAADLTGEDHDSCEDDT